VRRVQGTTSKALLFVPNSRIKRKDIAFGAGRANLRTAVFDCHWIAISLLSNKYYILNVEGNEMRAGYQP
jgi:hypothetical protein